MPRTTTDTSLTVVRGDSLHEDLVQWELRVDGTAVDLTGYSARLVVATKNGDELLAVDTDGSAEARLTISGTKVIPDVGPALTSELTPGTHLYDVEVTSPSGVVTTIVVAGKFKVVADVAT